MTRALPQSPDYFPWTPEHVETLKRLHWRGDSCSQIARELGGGLSRNAVIGKLSRLKLTSLDRDPSAPPPERGGWASKPRVPAVKREPKPALARPVRNFGGGPGGRVIAFGNTLIVTAPGQPLPPLRGADIDCEPRPWLTRRFGECAFPVSGDGADTLSCCNPTGEAVYCPGHAVLMASPRPSKKGSDFERSLRRYTA